jgi:anaerobic ribonucleoside-triphosphate reductase activating protein
MNGYIARICTSFIDVPDKIAVAVYFSGCSLRCKGCQNKQLWEKSAGVEMTVDDVLVRIKKNQLAQAVVFLGGEPTDQMEFLIDMCRQIKKEGSKEVVLYSGREFESLPTQLTDLLDLIVCGPYMEELHVSGWPASSNQRVLQKQGNSWNN